VNQPQTQGLIQPKPTAVRTSVMNGFGHGNALLSQRPPYALNPNKTCYATHTSLMMLSNGFNV
jgi:hypothetical protein